MTGAKFARGIQDGPNAQGRQNPTKAIAHRSSDALVGDDGLAVISRCGMRVILSFCGVPRDDDWG